MTTATISSGVDPLNPADEQAKLLAFLKRRHPEYDLMEKHWCFLEETYNGGREWFKTNIFRYVKEGDKEYDERRNRAYRFNHTRECTDLVQKYIFKSPIMRKEDDAPSYVKDFWKEATLSELSIDQYMKLVSTLSSTFGMIWVFADTTKTDDVVSIADAKKAKARCYSYCVKPQNVLDIGFDDQGGLNWILVREFKRDDADPITATGNITEQYRLWTKQDWTLYEIQEEGKGKAKRQTVVIVDSGTHGLDRVPCFPVSHVIGDSKYSAPALISDIAYLDRAVANYLSNLDAIIQDQTFSQLAMPAQGLMPGDDNYKALIEMGTKRIFVYDGEGGAAPQFLSPDPKQASVIVTVINKIITEIYHTIGMAGERTKQDNAMGIDNSSGVAKAYDFERMNSLLTSKAASLQNAENELVELVMAWNSAGDQESDLVKYPDTFDVRQLEDELSMASDLQLIGAPDRVRREQMKQVIAKLFPSIADDVLQAMQTELNSWPPPPPEPTSSTTPAGKKAPAQRPGTPSRQGQVTA